MKRAVARLAAVAVLAVTAASAPVATEAAPARFGCVKRARITPDWIRIRSSCSNIEPNHRQRINARLVRASDGGVVLRHGVWVTQDDELSRTSWRRDRLLLSSWWIRVAVKE